MEPHRSRTIPVHLYYQRADTRARLRLAQRGVSLEQSFIKQSPWPRRLRSSWNSS
ncbi:hypothetical protein ACNKHM_06555 [Shigella sonnei]